MLVKKFSALAMEKVGFISEVSLLSRTLLANFQKDLAQSFFTLEAFHSSLLFLDLFRALVSLLLAFR